MTDARMTDARMTGAAMTGAATTDARMTDAAMTGAPMTDSPPNADCCLRDRFAAGRHSPGAAPPLREPLSEPATGTRAERDGETAPERPAP